MSPSRPKDGGSTDSVRRCPICSHPRDERFKPFCSKRCADLDLARWLDGRYAIPGKDTDDDESSAKEREEEE